jgi:hypothetical protein
MAELKPCPFCGGEISLVLCDDEGNLHDESYRERPYSGLGCMLHHAHEDNPECPIASYECDGGILGGVYIYDTEEQAVEAWNSRVNEERMLDFPVKYTEICALYHFCVDLGIKCTIERLHDGYAVRFPDGSDFAQHHGTYGGTEGCVEPAIGDSEFDYTAVGLNLAKDLVKKHKGKLEADHA